jgi:hypothetical protein
MPGNEKQVGLATVLPASADAVELSTLQPATVGKQSDSNRIAAQMVSDPKRAAVLKEFRALVRGVIGASEKYLDAYREMCRYIRKHQLNPQELRSELEALEFSPSRISEIKRICYAPPEIYRDFERRAIGFKVALTKAREASETAETLGVKKFFTLAARLLKYFAANPKKKSAHLGDTALLLLRDKDYSVGVPTLVTLKGYEVNVVRVAKHDGKPVEKKTRLKVK